MKTCLTCGISKDESAFAIDRELKSGRRGNCKACLNAKQLEMRQAKAAREGREYRTHVGQTVNTATEKYCYRCKRVLPIEAFSKSSTRGLQGACKECRHRMDAEYRAKRPQTLLEKWKRQNVKERERRRADNPNMRAYDPPREIEPGVWMKICTRCHEDLPIASFRMVKGKPRTRCKPCVIADLRERYWANPEQARAAAREWYRAHPDVVVFMRQRYWAQHRDVLLARQSADHVRRAKQRQYANKRRSSMTVDERRAVNRLSIDAKRRWAKRNPQARVLIQQRRRARKAGSEIGTVDKAMIIARDRATCYLCGKKLTPRKITLDHVIPLAQGGPHDDTNLRVACRPCNSRKNARELSIVLSEIGKPAVQHVLL